MKTRFAFVLAAAVFALTNLAHAEDAATPVPDAAAKPHRHGDHKGLDCSKAADPQKCEARRQEMRERLAEAKKACAGKEGDDRRACYRDAMCAKAKDPQQCRERAEKRAQRFQEMKKACGDRQGDELRACMREQFKNGKGKDGAK